MNITMPKFKLDMDGVVADFLDAYLTLGEEINFPVKPPYTDNSRNPELFKIAVLNHNIFAELPCMPFALELKEHLEAYECTHGVEIEMLTSLNSYDPDVMTAAKKQKEYWLKNLGFNWPVNYVSANHEKAHHACGESILIDDNPECTIPFVQAGGAAILYAGFDEVFKSDLKNHINKILFK